MNFDIWWNPQSYGDFVQKSVTKLKPNKYVPKENKKTPHTTTPPNKQTKQNMKRKEIL